MAKKTTKKKAVRKAPARRAKDTLPEFDPTKHKGFNLNVGNQEQANELIAHIEVMKNTAGWYLMRQILEGNMAVLEETILTKRDPESGKEISDEMVDKCRMRRNYLKELVDKPDVLIAMFKRHAGMEVPEYDPYAHDVRQLRRDGSGSGAPMAGVLADDG